MKYLFALLLAGCMSLTSPPATPPSPVDITERSLDSVVALVNEEHRSYCAGVLVEHVILTAAHCVETTPAPILVAYREDYDWDHAEDVHEYVVSHLDVVEDIAVLVALDHRARPEPARLSTEMPWTGREVVVVGHPYGLTWTVTTGIVSAADRRRSGFGTHRWFQTSAPVSPGNSGGPVYNRYGEVMGIVSFRVGDAHLAGAVSLEVLREVLND